MEIIKYLEDSENRKDLAEYIKRNIPELLRDNQNTLVIQRRNIGYSLVRRYDDDVNHFNFIHRFRTDLDFTNIVFDDLILDKKFKNIINQYYRKLKIKEINERSI